MTYSTNNTEAQRIRENAHALDTKLRKRSLNDRLRLLGITGSRRRARHRPWSIDEIKQITRIYEGPID